MNALRMGILHVPDYDEEASVGALQTLRAASVDAFVMLETSAQHQRNWIADVLRRWCDEEEMDIILTIGGTMPAPGPSGREVVPEATSDVIERDLLGLAEAMRAYAQEESALAFLERGKTGVRGRTLILNLPYGSGAACLFLEGAVDLIAPVMAHLQELPGAPTLNGVLPGVSISEDEADEDAVESSKSGLSESEFAEYLRRSKERGAGEE